jgi:hypothetical protein
MAGHHTNCIQDEMLPAIPHHDANKLMMEVDNFRKYEGLRMQGRTSGLKEDVGTQYR